MKNSDDDVGTRTRDLPAYSAVRLPTASRRGLPRSTPDGIKVDVKYGGRIMDCRNL